VLPILHLNGYKISSPTVEARTPDEELVQLYTGRGHRAYFVEGDDPADVHQEFAAALDHAYADIKKIQDDARKNGLKGAPAWPMIILRTPKGWTGPKEVEGVPIEGTFRAHQVPLANVRTDSKQLKMLEVWMRVMSPTGYLIKMAGRYRNWSSSPRTATIAWVLVRTSTAGVY